MNLANKRVLVTGADGFIGSHLVEGLIEQGANVVAFVCYNSLSSWGWIESLPENIKEQLTVVSGDIRDIHSVRLAAHNCNIIFHLAALIAIPYSYDAPTSYVDTNINGTLNVLMVARELGDKLDRVIVTSTSEVYGTAIYAPINENHPLQAQSPYSATKIAADKLAESFWRSFGVPVVIARPFNTYGPRQSARAIIPTIITQLLSGASKIELGDLSPTRDFLYVKDTVRGFIEISKSSTAIGETLNIATGKEYSMGFVVDFLIKKINPNATLVTAKERLRPAGSEVFRLIGDSSKLQKISSWMPLVEIEAGLIETIEWFKENPAYLNLYKPKIYNK